MIEDTKGNLLTADAEALVNTVNCIGHMGKGIALQFKQAHPDDFKAYARACGAGEVKPGRMFIHETGLLMNPKYIINFPTKRHWRGPSRIEDIEAGLEALATDVERLGIRSVAVPPLGCGNGGLDWGVVRPMIVRAFERLPGVRVLLYAPLGAPEAVDMPVRTERPRMTVARALFVKLMQEYLKLDYRLTLLEIQKLAYFLQEAGEPLRLKYEAGHYGPYAANLNKVLERIEGHFTRGYGDSRKPDVEIELLPGSVEEADTFLIDKKESTGRLARVAELIEGLETPYGMELLSSVHWVLAHEAPPASDIDTAVERVHGWNDRKRELLKPEHVRTAWRRLKDRGWVAWETVSCPQKGLDEHLQSEPLASSDAVIEVSEDAEAYMAVQQLDGEFLQAKAIAEDVFSGASEMRLELQVDPGDQDAGSALVLGVVTAAFSTDFRTARKRFFRMLRSSGCARLCLSLAVVREQ